MTHHEHDYAAQMRKRGFRVTPQRQLILDAICEAGGHTTPEEIYNRVQTKSTAINRATVYRTLDFLCQMRLVVAAHVGGGTMVYELAGERPHHHLICRACGQTASVGHEMVEQWFAQIEQETSFSVDMDHLVLFGLCEHCRQSKIDGSQSPSST
ncbi:MAG: Fur family transcriptional regulator [Anaerolineae bacterium]